MAVIAEAIGAITVTTVFPHSLDKISQKNPFINSPFIFKQVSLV